MWVYIWTDEWPDEWPDIDEFNISITKTLTAPTDYWHAFCCSVDGKYIYGWVGTNWLCWYYLSDGTLNTLPASATYSKTGTWTSTRCMYISPSWEKLFSGTDWSWVYLFNMGTKYDLSNSTVSWSWISGRRTATEFSPDGLYFYTWTWYTSWNPISQYQCSTPFDLSTASLLRNFNTNTSGRSYTVRFSSSWLKMYVSDRWSSLRIYQFNLTTPRDISTASLYTTRSFSEYTSWEDWAIFGFANGGRRLFIMGVAWNKIHQYDV